MRKYSKRCKNGARLPFGFCDWSAYGTVLFKRPRSSPSEKKANGRKYSKNVYVSEILVADKEPSRVQQFCGGRSYQ
jgi:hypothetical protein